MPTCHDPHITIAYKGYLIRRFNSKWWVEKDGHLICWPKDEQAAKRDIDLVADGK